MKLSANTFIRLSVIIQIICALVITILGIVIAVKFVKIHHENGTQYEFALEYVGNPWMTKYAAGVWMGLIILIAGIFGSFLEQKPHKSKYKYYTFASNVAVVIFALVLIVYSAKAISWFTTCQYIYIKSNGVHAVSDCSSEDKSAGKLFYTLNLVFVIIVAIATVALLVLIPYEDPDTFRDCSPRRMMYKWNARKKPTHTFDQHGSEPQIPDANINTSV